MLLELLLGLISLLLAWDYLYKKHRNDVLQKYQIKGPRAYPIIGSALELRGLDTESMLHYTRSNVEKYGKIHRHWILNNVTVLITDPKYIETILSSQQLIQKSDFYDFLSTWLGNGLLLSTGRKWHRRRKIITPTFHFKILEQFVEIFDQQSAIMAEKLYAKADGKTAVNIFPIVCLCALDIIAETAMGVKINAQQNPDIEYVKAVAQTAILSSTRFVKPLQRIDWLFRLTAPKQHRELNKSIEIMHDFTDKVIKQRRATLQQSNKEAVSTATQENDIGSKQRMALLDVLLQSTVEGEPLSNADIREEVDTFMFEGHDTTTSAISYCLYLLSRHAEVQKKCVEEILQVIGTDKNRAVSYRELHDLKYLECVIKETLRLYPSVPAIGRMTTQDIQLDDIIIPAKTDIRLVFLLTHMDADYFPEPQLFKPERFSAEQNVQVNPFAYVPFSAGPRNCIGQKFAMMELKSTVSKVLRHFELLPLGPEVRPMINLILRSATGMHVGLKVRKLV